MGNLLNRTLSAMPIRLDMPRSGIHTGTGRVTTFNAGKLVPLFRPIEVLPGDTFDLRTGYVLRTSNPPIRPVLDKAFFDQYFFFVPMRLVWEHTKEFFGENKTSYWVPATTYQIPQLRSNASGYPAGGVADHLYSLPPGIDVGDVSALEARGYCLIWNEYFRDQNYMNPAAMPTGEAVTAGVTALGSPLTNAVKGGELLPVCKYHDYFTSALPNSQKAAKAVTISGNDILPVITYNQFVADKNYNYPPLMFRGNFVPGLREDPQTIAGMTKSSVSSKPVYKVDTELSSDSVSVPGNPIYGPINLGLDATLIGDINQLRFAVQLQKFYEKQAVGGTRFREALRAMYGSTIPDATSQIPEYLGGSHQQIGMQQVIQTSATVSGQTPQANAAAYSYTANGDRAFLKSFCEPGWIFCLGCVRTNHTYQQGVNRQFRRRDLTDIYNPLFANLGMQPIRESELYFNKAINPDGDEVALGYQEAWAEYRYFPRDVTGQMRAGVTGSLSVWNYADYYDVNEVEDIPFINDEFMAETSANIDRTLSVQSSVSDQFIIAYELDVRMYRVMPLYSVPGLLDHH